MCQVLVMAAVMMVLVGIMTQGVIVVRRHAELTALTNRASHLGTALELYSQRNRRFPDAYPANLEEDLAPYIDDPDLFVSPADPDAGAAPLNRSYVTPVLSERNTYVLSFNARHDRERSVVLFADSSVETVERLPVLHNDQSVVAGGVVSGGTLTFAGGSTIELSEGTTATVVQSFRSSDGNPFDIVKIDNGLPGFLTAVAVDADIVQVASAAGVTLVRGGVVDVVFTKENNEDFMKVSARSGEVIVNGRIVRNGQLVGETLDNNQSGPLLFTIDDDYNLIAQEDCIAKVQVLGKAITYGSGGPDCAVEAGARIGDEDWGWLFGGAQVQGGEEYSREISKGTRVAVKGRATYGDWSREYRSTEHRRQVLVLINGDTPPQFDPFDNQPPITAFCSSVIDATTGRIQIANHQALFLFELGTTNMQSPAADFQDLVLLVDFARVTDWSGGEEGTQAISGRININPNNNRDFEFILQRPDGSRITRDTLLASNRQFEYTGQATMVRVKPKGNGNQNSLIVDGVAYELHNGQVYMITSSNMTVHLYNDKDSGYGNGMGRWWIEITAASATINEEALLEVGSYEVTLSEDNMITVHQNGSMGIRVLGTSLTGSNGRSVRIALDVKVDQTWHTINKGRGVSEGYLHTQQVEAGSQIALKAMSYYGSKSASYHSADGSGHVLTMLKGQVPDRFDPTKNPPSLEDFTKRAMNPSTHSMHIGNNQVAMLFELGKDDASDTDARFQDIAVVLTFTPDSLHAANEEGNGFDGYISQNTTDPVGPAAEAFAGENSFAWTAIRQADLPPDDGGMTGDPVPVDDEPDDGYTGNATGRDRTGRILGRGSTVRTGRWVKATRF